MEIRDISGRIATFYDQMLGAEAQHARRNARALWNSWLQFKSDDRIDETLVARASQQSLSEEYLRAVREMEQLKAVQEGRIAAEIPGLPQPMELRFLLFFLPYAASAIYFYIAWVFIRMKSCISQTTGSELQEWTATTAPFIALDNVGGTRLALRWIGRACVASLPLVAVVALVSFNRTAIDLGFELPIGMVGGLGVLLAVTGFLCVVVCAIRTSRVLGVLYAFAKCPDPKRLSLH